MPVKTVINILKKTICSLVVVISISRWQKKKNAFQNLGQDVNKRYLDDLVSVNFF